MTDLTTLQSLRARGECYGAGSGREVHRCRKCTADKGPVRSNARPHDGDMTPYEWKEKTDDQA